MAGEIDFPAINGLAKKVYDKSGVKDLLPSDSILQKRFTWENGTRNVGESYNISVMLRPPNGFTYAGSTGVLTALKAARNMVIKQATITPFEMDLREQMTFTALSRAAKEGEGAFKQLTGIVFEGMKTAASNRLEFAILNGQRNIGVVESVTDLGGNLGNIVITEASWRPGLWWAAGEGATVDSFTSTTKNNGTGALILSKVTASTRTLKFTYSGTLSSECAAGDVLYWEGAWDGTTYNEMPGVMAQAENITGTSLGLSATTYGNWAGNTYDVAGNLSSDIVEDACSILRDRGVKGKLALYVCNKAFSVLMNELKQLRVMDSSYSPEKGKVGTKGVEYYSPDIGTIEVVNHPYMARSEFLLLNDDDVGRVGSSDLTFGVPGMSEQLFRLLDGYNACELILYTDQCVILKKPAHAMVGTGITYS